MLFRAGKTVMTRGIADTIQGDESFASEIIRSLDRHFSGDWGDLCEDDKKMNDEALAAEQRGEDTDRLFSAYRIGEDKVYVITEYDRSVTTVLFADEY